jgi:hypothetical protein
VSDHRTPISAPSTPTVSPLPARRPSIDVLKRPTMLPRRWAGATSWMMVCAIDVNAMLKMPARISRVTAAG